MIAASAPALMLAQSPLAPAWIVLPLAIVTMLVLAGYHQALRETAIPESRRRIRTANSMVMLIATPLIAYALGIASPDEPRVFVMVWLSVMGLLGATVLLAVVDVLNTLRLHRADLRALRAQNAAVHRELLELAHADDAPTRSP